MNQSNALRRLEIVLYDAVQQGKPEESGGRVLLQAMKVQPIPSNLVYFHALLAKAYAEAEGLTSMSKISNNLRVLVDLNELFTSKHLWETKWNEFSNHMQARYILNILDLLANEQHRANPKFALESDFLEKIQAEFDSLVQKIKESNLSQNLKKDLIKKVESILKSIRQYNVGGTEGIEQDLRIDRKTIIYISSNCLKTYPLTSQSKCVRRIFLLFAIAITV